jgi:hypothetical protein
MVHSAVMPRVRHLRCTAKPNSKIEVLHAHKDDCHDAAENRFVDPDWDELSVYLSLVHREAFEFLGG